MIKRCNSPFSSVGLPSILIGVSRWLKTVCVSPCVCVALPHRALRVALDERVEIEGEGLPVICVYQLQRMYVCVCVCVCVCECSSPCLA